jgi:hypothetical protein
MEDAAVVRSLVVRLGLVGCLLVLAPGATRGAPPPGLAEVVRGLGAPGALWGRLLIEEESPDGPWTPLAGVEVRIFPFVPQLAADLEEIRRRARDSGPGYDTAVARFRERLEAHAADLKAHAAPERPLVREQVTGATGLFLFEAVPAGEWLVVALRLTEYTALAARAPRESRRAPSPGRDSTFLPRPQAAAREAEIWLQRVRVPADERVRLWLTDRGRFMVGPLR